MKHKNLAYVYLIIAFCFWGSLYVVGKFLMLSIPTFTVSMFRYLIASAALLPVLYFKKPKKIERQDYKYIFMIGFFGYFISISAQLLGTKLAGASLASLINSLNPVAIMIAAAFLLHEKFTLRKGISIALALAGVYTIIGGGSGETHTTGILVSLLSVLLWAATSVSVKKIMRKYDPLQITAYGIALALIFTIPVSAVELLHAPAIHVNAVTVISLLYMGVCCTGLAHVFWNKSLSMLEAGTCSMFYPVQPMVSVLLGAVFLGEEIGIRFLIGAALIVAGVMACVLQRPSVKA